MLNVQAEKLTQFNNGSSEEHNGRPLSEYERRVFESIEKEEYPHRNPTEVVDEVNPGALWREARIKNRIGNDETVESPVMLQEEVPLSEQPPLLSGDTRAKEWQERQKISWTPTDIIPTEEAFYNFERFARPGKKAEAERQELARNQDEFKDEVVIEYPRDTRGIVGWLTRRFQTQPRRERMTYFEGRRTYGLVGFALARLNEETGRTTS